MGMSRHKKAGILQTFGMETYVTWCSFESLGDGYAARHLNREKLIVEPRFLRGSTSSEIAQALEDSLRGSFSWADLEELMRHHASSNMKVIVVSMCADQHPSNNLVKHLWAARAEAHNRRTLESGEGVLVVLLDGPCYGHILNRIQNAGFGAERL
eukprot:7283690-Pyramimonas_sp.AAC.1